MEKNKTIGDTESPPDRRPKPSHPVLKLHILEKVMCGTQSVLNSYIIVQILFYFICVKFHVDFWTFLFGWPGLGLLTGGDYVNNILNTLWPDLSKYDQAYFQKQKINVWCQQLLSNLLWTKFISQNGATASSKPVVTCRPLVLKVPH